MKIWFLALFLFSRLTFAQEEIGLNFFLFHQRGYNQNGYLSDREEIMKIPGKLINEGKDYYLVSEQMQLKLKINALKKGHVCAGFLCLAPAEHLSFKLSPEDFKTIVSAMVAQRFSGVTSDIQSMLKNCFDADPKTRHKCEIDSGGSSRFKDISANFLDPEKCESYTMNFVNDDFGLRDLIRVADAHSDMALSQELEETSFSLRILLDKPKDEKTKLIPKSFR